MRTKRTLPVLALGLLLVAGCGQGDDPVESSTPPSATQDVGTVNPVTPTPEESTAEAEPSGEPATDEPAEPTGSASAPVTEDPSTVEPVAGEWLPMTVEVRTAEDAGALSDLPESFRAYAVQLVETPDPGGCQSELTITGYHPAGYVTGQDFAPGCGGSNVVWSDAGGNWGIVLSMQALLDCAEFENNYVPEGSPDLMCLDESGAQVAW